MTLPATLHRVARGVLFAGMLAFAGMSSAHPLAPRLLEIVERTGGVVDVRWKEPNLTPAGLQLAPSLPEACRVRTPVEITPAGSGLLYAWSMHCPEEGLVGLRIGVEGLSGSRANVLLRIHFEDGRLVQELLGGDRSDLVVPERTRSFGLALRYAGLGGSHLLGGLDHVLFLLCLMLLITSTRSLVLTISAFTGGHALTLSLATLGWIRPPQGWVELSIAFSIVVLAAELAAGRGAPSAPRRSLLGRHPWAMAFAFGLLHGLGFASVLEAIGLPRSEIVLALLSFNLGIELGQILLVGGLLGTAALVAAWVRKLGSPPCFRGVWPRATALSWARQGVSYLVGTAAAYWCVERALQLV